MKRYGRLVFSIFLYVVAGIYIDQKQFLTPLLTTLVSLTLFDDRFLR